MRFVGPRFRWGSGAALLVAVAVGGMGTRAVAQEKKELRIAAASDLQPVMPALADLYLKKTGVRLVVNFGSSGALATQIENGAPVDLFHGSGFYVPGEDCCGGAGGYEGSDGVCAGEAGGVGEERLAAAAVALERLMDPRVTEGRDCG